MLLLGGQSDTKCWEWVLIVRCRIRYEHNSSDIGAVRDMYYHCGTWFVQLLHFTCQQGASPWEVQAATLQSSFHYAGTASLFAASIAMLTMKNLLLEVELSLKYCKT